VVLLGDEALVEICLVHLEIVLQKIGAQFWTHLMELVSDVGREESRFSPFGDSVSVSARLEHGLHRTYHRHRNHFGRS
jgi:hypothetical protein